jgi:hypothetical protein
MNAVQIDDHYVELIKATNIQILIEQTQFLPAL